jgi:sulfur carrier protein
MSAGGTVAPMLVTANGRPVDLPEGATVAVLIERMGLGGRVVVVERNGEPVDRRSVGDTVLTDGDRCEVVRAVAGG